jgi:hypothetical protein
MRKWIRIALLVLPAITTGGLIYAQSGLSENSPMASDEAPCPLRSLIEQLHGEESPCPLQWLIKHLRA